MASLLYTIRSCIACNVTVLTTDNDTAKTMATRHFFKMLKDGASLLMSVNSHNFTQ